MVQNGSTMSTPSHDLVVFGATSFVGKILCRYLREEFGAQGAMKWAAAGRSKAKLEELRSALGATAGTLPLVVADAADEALSRRLPRTRRFARSSLTPIRCAPPGVRPMCGNPTSDRRNSMSTSALVSTRSQPGHRPRIFRYFSGRPELV
jgi:hypothetical protein